MRVEPYSSDSIVHAIKRGTRGMPLTRDSADKYRFVRLLHYANDSYHDEYWERNTKDLGLFERPTFWPERQPLVKILGWSLMTNHFHLILKELQEKGISKFMQKLCGSMTTHFNSKYEEQGSIFQSSYKGKTANLRGDEYLKLLAVYVMVKNPFELYEGGLKKAIEEFDKAYAWASEYPFCSLGSYAGKEDSTIVDKDIFRDIFQTPKQFKDFAQDSLLYKLDQLNSLEFEKSGFSKRKVGKSDLPKIKTYA